MAKVSLKDGDSMPEFNLPNQEGRIVRSVDLIGKGPFVIYFYPHDDTPGCTTEACAFRDAFEYFKDGGANVIGISSDTPESHRKFIKKHNLPFTLLSDEQGMAREAFGVPKTMGMLPGRVTYVMDGKGVIRYVFNSQTHVEQHVNRSLDIINKLTGKT